MADNRDFIVEVEIPPSGETKQLQFHSRVTVDHVKYKIFKNTASLATSERLHYVLQLADTQEFLFVEFLKFLSTDALKERSSQGLPIAVRVVARDKVYSKSSKKKQKQKARNALQSQKAVTPNLPRLVKKSSDPQISTPKKSEKAEPQFRLRRGSCVVQSSSIVEHHHHSLPGISVTPKKKLPKKITFDELSPPKQKENVKINRGTPNMERKIKDMVTVQKKYSMPPIEVTFEDDWVDEHESELIQPEQFGFHTEVGNRGLPIEKFNKNLFNVEMPLQENLYEKYFFGKDHSNYIGKLESVGPIVLSLIRNRQNSVLRALVRIPEKTYHVCVDNHSSGLFGTVKNKTMLKTVLGKTPLKVSAKSLKRVKGSAFSKEIMDFDQSHLVTKLKFGVLYCKEGQSTEDEWFGNEHGSPDFEEFLGIIGTRIMLKGWPKFRAGLDTKTDSTGLESVFVEHANKEIMFHVSTLLPYSEADVQKIERKRHLGNDIVVLIFVEGDFMFPPSICKSVFNHVYIVVKKEDENYYKVGVTIKDGVRSFGPSFPYPPLVHKDLLRDFLLVKMLNAEWAAYRSLEFAHKYKRTRNLQLSNLLKSYSG